SRAVVQSAQVPVLVVKTEAVNEDDALEKPVEKPAGAGDKKLRVLVAYDVPAVGERIAAVLGQVEWPPITEGLVMHVVQPMFLTELPDWLRNQQRRDPDVQAMADAWKKEHEQNVATARQELQTFQARLPAAFSQQPPIIVEGRPADQLLAALERER